MKQYVILFLITILSLPSCAQETEKNAETKTSTFYFIRHAEKDRSDKSNRNPELTEKGHQRAIQWREVFSSVKFDRVYSTDYFRTKQTAMPTAKANNLELTLYNPRDLDLDGKAFLNNNKGKTVLVVGHSNTTPMFVNAVLGNEKYAQIDDNNNANLYIITVTPTGEMNDVLLVID